jgi:hypothetical protein
MVIPNHVVDIGREFYIFGLAQTEVCAVIEAKNIVITVLLARSIQEKMNIFMSFQTVPESAIKLNIGRVLLLTGLSHLDVIPMSLTLGILLIHMLIQLEAFDIDVACLLL